MYEWFETSQSRGLFFVERGAPHTVLGGTVTQRKILDENDDTQAFLQLVRLRDKKETHFSLTDILLGVMIARIEGDRGGETYWLFNNNTAAP